MFSRSALSSCETAQCRHPQQSLIYISYTTAASNWPSENNGPGSNINLNRVIKKSRNWKPNIHPFLNFCIVKEGRKKKGSSSLCWRLKLQVRLLQITSGQELPAEVPIALRWTASPSLLSQRKGDSQHGQGALLIPQWGTSWHPRHELGHHQKYLDRFKM